MGMIRSFEDLTVKGFDVQEGISIYVRTYLLRRLS